MIPAWLTLRVAAYGALGAALLATFLWYGHARHAAGEASGNARAVAAEAARDQAVQTLKTERADRQRAEDASHAYQTELADLRARPVPSSPVRLCKRPSVPSTAPGPAGPAGAATGAGSLPATAGDDSAQGSGVDIGPDLRTLALSCDEVSARLRALQGWAITGVAKTVPARP